MNINILLREKGNDNTMQGNAIVSTLP